MVSIGNNIKSSADQLQKSTVENLYEIIRTPDSELSLKLRQIRMARSLSPAKYSELKALLPYFVCAVFNPPYRKTVNFAYTEYFIIDIDHISESGLTALEIKRMVSQDPRVCLAFISPSGDGVKVMLKLRERCYDAALYRVFYKSFVLQFDKQYNLHQSVDSKTCDVTRACFLCHDPEAYFNPQPESVRLNDYVDTEKDVFSALEMKKDTDEFLKEIDSLNTTEAGPADPDNDAMEQIRRMLNPNARQKVNNRPVYVPSILEEIMAELKSFVEGKGIELSEVRNIQYGKKLRFLLGNKQAEVNLFFGKRGFSVVKSPRTGTNPDLNNLMVEVIETFLAEHF